MSLYLRRIIHPQAHDNYRVILKLEDGEFEIGSIGIQHSAGTVYFWAWGIDTGYPDSHPGDTGKGKDCRDCMKQFKAAWERFAADEGFFRCKAGVLDESSSATYRRHHQFDC